MVRMRTKVTAALTTAGVLGALMTPSSALAVTIRIEDNGAFSKNAVEYRSESNVSVEQSNETNAAVAIDASANTGNNSTSGHHGSIVTGDATNAVSVSVKGGSNYADLSFACECDEHDKITVRDNGKLSYNDAAVSKEKHLDVTQHNETNAAVQVDTKANTGGNSSRHGYDFFDKDHDKYNDHKDKKDYGHDTYDKRSYDMKDDHKKDTDHDKDHEKKMAYDMKDKSKDRYYHDYDNKHKEKDSDDHKRHDKDKSYGMADYDRKKSFSYKLGGYKWDHDRFRGYLMKRYSDGHSGGTSSVVTGDAKNSVGVTVTGGHNVLL